MKHILFSFCLFASVAFGIERDQINAMLQTAATNQGNAYLAGRNAITNECASNLALLAQAGNDASLSWQQRLTARIAYERIARGSEIETLRAYNWRQHPGYDANWERYITGPVAQLWRITVPHFIKTGLWYYYVELSWKRTGETAITNDRRIKDEWPYWCRMAVAGQPENPYKNSPGIAATMGYDPTIAPTEQPEVYYLRLVMTNQEEKGLSLTQSTEPPFRLGTNLVVFAP